ncbi:YggS family pyridoxal phosphate-dependent enzyme [Lichenicola sp.]|uniref:YggS family pyridoxal phosphate-dependent enzyme n=1 Tax=Lichenicola sp. TaxID=2804529 RepID=UPI003B00524C
MTPPDADADTGDLQLPDDRIGAALQRIRRRIETAASEAGRDPAEVTLVAVSKTHPASAIAAAVGAGQIVFGENRVQEAQAKFPQLRAARMEAGAPGPVLHLIGPLQTNKALEAVRLADVIETLDRPRLADAIDQAAQKAGRLPDLLVQVNIGSEPQKAGIALEDADRFIETCRQRFGSVLTGLMAIPPADVDPQPFFHRLAAMAAAHGLAGISMGMSGDFEQAIACGATSVRIGTAIFGGRPAPVAPDAGTLLASASD